MSVSPRHRDCGRWKPHRTVPPENRLAVELLPPKPYLQLSRSPLNRNRYRSNSRRPLVADHPKRCRSGRRPAHRIPSSVRARQAQLRLQPRIVIAAALVQSAVRARYGEQSVRVLLLFPKNLKSVFIGFRKVRCLGALDISDPSQCSI